MPTAAAAPPPSEVHGARSGEWRHPVVGLWPVGLREDLRRALIGEPLHKIELWTALANVTDRKVGFQAALAVLAEAQGRLGDLVELRLGCDGPTNR